MADGTNPKDLIGITKVPLRFIPPPALARLAKVMEHGAKKYGPFNWREQPVQLTVYLEAALRHIYSYMDGEDDDEESGQPHIAHTMACMAIMLDALDNKTFVDDRFHPGCFAALVKELKEEQ